MGSFWYFFDTKHSWEKPILIISNAYLSSPILIKLTLISLFPHHPRKSGLAKDTNYLHVTQANGKVSILIVLDLSAEVDIAEHSLLLETLPSVCFQETISSSFIFFLPAVLATPSLSPLLISPQSLRTHLWSPSPVSPHSLTWWSHLI